ncbi:MAG: class I SAM-dependent methyltransferase [Bacteroidetes bacterium]|nr:class I SAM-dependent methyltransferase [Bacteroidota bacterium]
MPKINYGIDAPNVVRNLCVIGAVFLLLVIFLPDFNIPETINAVKSTLFFPGIFMLLTGLFMLYYSRVGKFRQRERILHRHQWQGAETVLDIGAGLGLLMIGAAKKLTIGKAYGIDIFNSTDLSGNTIEQIKQNIQMENVSEKTIIVNKNILDNGFGDAMFDVIVSNLCLHNIHGKEKREQACREIFRILKPGGTAIISDFTHLSEYTKTFKALGMRVQNNGTSYFDTFPPLTIITAQKN